MHTISRYCTVAVVALLLCAPSGGAAQDAKHPEAASAVPASEALARLKAGKQHFVDNTPEHPHQTADRRKELATGQHPFAVVLACADSRTSPEVVFDEGLGDVFVVRVAGNVVNDQALGSIEYAVQHLGAQLIVVLGHERCGAIQAAREAIAAKVVAPGHIQSLVTAIAPAVEATAGADAEATARANELNVARTLRESEPILKAMVDKGTVVVMAAHYDLDTGVVEFLEEPGAK